MVSRSRPRHPGWYGAIFASLLLHFMAGWGLCHWPQSADAPKELAQPMGTVRFHLKELSPDPDDADQGQGFVTPAYFTAHPPTFIPDTPIFPHRDNLGSIPEPTPSETKGNLAQGAGSAGTGPGRGYSTSFFQIETRSQKVLYLLDSSASMGLGGAWSTASRELLASLKVLPATARFQVVVYNSTPRLLIPARSAFCNVTCEPALACRAVRS